MSGQNILSKFDDLKINDESNVEDFIFDNSNMKDDDKLNYINTKISGHNETKKNIANYILNSKKNIKLTEIDNLSTFFNLLKPLNSEYDLGMPYWEINVYKDKKIITFHNNVSKVYYKFIYDKYIDKIKKKLVNCKTEFYYKELKEYRYNKTIEVIFIFRL